MARNTKVASGAKSRNIQSGNMRNKAGSNYVHQKTVIPKKLKRKRDVVLNKPVTPAQAELLEDISMTPHAGTFSKRHRLVDPMAYEPLHQKLLHEIATRSADASASKSKTDSKR